jgi:hypothetical protein
MRYRIAATTAALAVGVCAHDAGAIVFDFAKTSSTTDADYATILPELQEAAARWSANFGDDITINLSIGYVTLSPGTIGSTIVTTVDGGAYYSSVVDKLTLDATTASDATAVASLQGGNAFSVLTRDRPSTDVLVTPPTQTVRNTALVMPSAEAKALGFLAGNDTVVDATITFSKAYTFDYDGSDGISAGLVDFVGVATHEIGHAMGFSSGVDTIDRSTGSGPLADGVNTLSANRIYYPLDLFRHSATAGLGVISGIPGDDAYFSLDGGATAIAQFSRGFYNGNGAQASHWLDNLGLGIMDPTAQKGELLSISSNDLLAFDAIGYDLVPEPSSLALLLVVGGASMLTRRRRHTADGAS